MKLTKKVMSLILCVLMLTTSIYNDGWSHVFEEITASAMAGHEQKYSDTRVELDFNKDWLFAFSDNDAAYLKGFDDSDWESVDIPHDFSMSQDFTTDGTEAESGRLPGGTGWYRKWFNLYEYYTPDRIFLNFDGAYQHVYVYVNGKYVGENHYGYNSFSFEISDYLICSNTAKNLIAVKVVNDLPNSRWYSGSGIYRDVTLSIAGPVHVALYGPRITTPDLHTSASVHVDAKIKMHNDTAISKIVTVEATVLDKDHNPVSETVISDPITIPAETEKEITLTPEVVNPDEWSIDNPALYKLRTIVKDKTGEIIDEYHTTFGFRCMEWTEDGGFLLNHEHVKLKGVCLHHDQGALGAVQEYEAVYRQLATLKDMGCNAIRTSHNTTSKVVIEICNELGILVVEEFFDGWDASKNYNENDFSRFFNEKIDESNTAIGAKGQKWFQYVVEHAILRDEHDPCVIAWDIGNELCNITEGESTANYESIADSIIAICDTLDPSRVVFYGNNRPFGDETTKMLDDKMDVIGGNYSPEGWAYVMNDPTDSRSGKPFVATEAASAINSRGVYYTMGKDDATKQCTSYDTNAVSWGNEAAEAWYYTIANDWFSGEFIWTGFDYIGEPTPWDDIVEENEDIVPVSSYFGVVDTAGFEKDSYYLYRSWWNEDSTTLHLVPGSWNEEKLSVTNGYVPVAVYSNAAKIELLLNGNIIATAVSTDVSSDGGLYTYKTWQENVADFSKCTSEQFYNGTGADLYAQFNVKYEEGTLSVKAYDENNNEITDTVGSSASVSGNATQIVSTVWGNRNTFVADGTDYVYIEFEARDADGNFMNDYNGTLSVKVDDSSARYAKIVGVDNGNPATTEKFQQKSVIISDSEAEIQMFNGRALVILRTTDEEGTINVTAIADDGENTFSTQGVTVTSVSESGIKLSDELHEVIRQNETEYQVTLYDEFEIVKHYINKLTPPEGGSGDTGDSGEQEEQPVQDKFEIYIPEQSATDGCIEEGYYALNVSNVLMTEDVDNAWAMTKAECINVTEWAPSGSGYFFNTFTTDRNVIFEFIRHSENTYYIKSKSTGKYLYVTYFENGNRNLTLEDTPQPFTVSVNDNGSVRICSEVSGSSFYIGCPWDVFCVHPNTDSNLDIWLYSAPEAPVTIDTETYSIYLGDKSSVDGVVQSGNYVIYNQDIVMTNTYGAAIKPDFDLQDKTAAQGSYPYEDFCTYEKNEFIFTHLGNNQYHIKNAKNGKYVTIGGYYAYLGDYPQVINITLNNDGSFIMSADNITDDFKDKGRYYLVYREDWNCFYAEHELYAGNVSTSTRTKMWLYSKPYKTSISKIELYNVLFTGIAEDYHMFTRESFEILLRQLENGVSVYSDPKSKDADYTAAAQAIKDAIAALEMDIKQIDGTLFKYGYDNTGDTPDYSAGGTLMNDISVRTMKNAILADSNLVRQIKDIIGYDTRNWEPGYADKALDEVAEIYARIYSLQFIGVPYANYEGNKNAASNYLYADDVAGPLMTLWNIYTKDNTHGAEDPIVDYGNNNMHEVHNGASVQGLAGATLENGVVTSHAAYQNPLSYANDGHDYEDNSEDTDIDFFRYGLTTNGNDWWDIRLEYLEGISVYFPDMFTRENLDADGNVTTATKGQFAKYYWDAEFPIFISTDEYGVNTYQFNSKDTTHLVQAEFDDENQTVDMELNEVGHWGAVGPNDRSGFFPFNYQKGATDLESEKAIYHYGFTFEHNFYIPKGGKHANGEDVVFNFSGDDDVLVYIDGVLVLDNGGLHGAREVTINFTNCTINYQFAMDVADTVSKDGCSYAKLKGGEYECTYSYNKLVENHPDAANYSPDTIAALNKLHQVISDGQVHTLNFFYLERGASDSNCRMSFNLSETSEEVRIIDQTLTLDYGLPVEYNIEDNNNLSQAAVDNNVKVEYLGLCAVNEEVHTRYTFELPEIDVPFEDGATYTVDGMKYGTCTIDNEGNTTYTLNSMNMTEAEHFYVCAKITADPTYAADVVYYQIEKTTFVPATSIYYEDTFDTLTYTDGKVPSNYDNSVNNYGIWKTSGMQETTLRQSADLTDSEANPYGYETNYMSFAQYSGGSTHYVDVSTKNNPQSAYSGGSGAAWPTVDFTFTGTGFDLISVSDSTTGIYNVIIRNEDGRIVRNHLVDTFYGYNYGRIYNDANGNPTLESSGTTPMYRSEEGLCTPTKMYYDENGAITDIPHYYDADGNSSENITDNPAYAYAYGWILAEDGSRDTLYQIPVIKVTDLEYDTYSVTITPSFSSRYGHFSTAQDGTNYYRLYLDAIKIFDPAGKDDGIEDKEVKDAYTTDDELYPSYLELKDMLIGADSLSEPDAEKQGIIFIDGIAALDNNIETYKYAGPNNELYLAKDQAVAFEIIATAVPTDIQLGTKLACGSPALTVSYDSKTTEIEIETATDLYYSLNTVLPGDRKLTWQQITAADGNNYYTTGTVVIQNTGNEDSVLSITNLKWTFSQFGGKGYFRIPTPVEEEVLMVASTYETPAAAYSLMRMRTAALDIEQSGEPEVSTDADGNSVVSVKLNTSSDVASLVVSDENGNPLSPGQYEYSASENEDENIIEWTVNITVTGSGTFTYLVAGAYENGYTDISKTVSVEVTVEEPQTETEPENKPEDTENDGSFFDSFAAFFRRLFEFLKSIFALFGITV